MKNLRVYLRIVLGVLFLCVGNMQAWGGNTYYGRGTANVSSASPTGSGTVYVSTTNSGSGTYANTSNAIGSANGQGSATVTVYAFARANENYEFVGWNSQNGTTATTLTNNPQTISGTATNDNQNNPTNIGTLYAIFAAKPVFYFSATAFATPAGGGTASVSPATTNVRGEHWNSTSATTTATFTATPNTGYNFLGWSTTADGAVVSTANPYNATLTSTSTNSGSPTNTTIYAKYEQIIVPSAISATPSTISICAGDNGTFTYTLTPSNAYDNVIVTSGNTGIATVSKTGTTITVTSVAAGSTTVTLSARDDLNVETASTTVAVTVISQCTAPSIGGYDNATGKVTITPAANTTVYYTTDGSDPTDGSTAYSAPFDLTEPATVKAIAYRDGYCPSTVTSRTVAKVATPTINIDDAGVTFSGAAGATYYYSIGGGDPTTQWDGSTPITGLSEGDVIKVMAKQAGMINSDVATSAYQVPSGVSGGNVILNDREDHAWSHYSDPDCPIRSLNPADVKITYYGDGIVMTGNADYTSSSTDFIQPGNANYVGGAKVNVTTGEDQSTFIYYKTLERTDGSTSANPTGRCAYTTIPNPFQVRPTYGTPPNSNRAAWTGWRGFQCWRLKSVTGGAVYSAAAGGTALALNAIINAETEIYFAPNSEYGMEVELEAVWAIAYLVYATGDGSWSVPNHADLGYERNFVVLSSNKDFYFRVGNGNNTAYISDINRPSTITPYLPNGTSGNGQIGRVRGEYANNNNNSVITLQADTKFENVQFTNLTGNSNIITAAGYNLIVGRGCTSTNVGTVRGLSDNTSGAVEYTIRLESGTFGTFDMIDGTTHTHSGTVSARTVFGSDYDRAKSDNDKLSIGANNTVYGASSYQQFTSNTNRNNLTYDWNIKSGKVQASKGVAAGSASECIYMGNSGSGNDSDGNRYQGKRRMIMEGGEVCNIAGGLNNYGNNYANYIVNDGWALQIRIKGGTVRGSVYGAAEFAGASGDRQFIITGGTINGWVAGGANGTHNDGGELYGSTALYIGGTTVVGSESGGTHVGGYNSSYGTNGADGGNVFGAGCGILPNNGNYQNGTVGRVNSSIVAVADETTIWRDVYGGGNYGWVRDDGTTGIYILGGTVNGSVYGGSNNQQGQEVTITMKGGTIKGNTIGDATRIGGLYGGSNSWGTINDNVTMQIDGGQVGTSSKNANIHGGGYGANTAVNGNVSLTLGASTTATDSATVNGNVYGGSALGRTNNGSATNTTTVTMNKALVNGNLFGGAYGNGANVNGRITVNVNGGRVDGNVFGGGDAAAYNKAGQNYPVVNMTGGQVTNVFGGGKGSTAVVTGNPQVTLSGTAHVTGNVYGGGDAAEVSGQTNVILRD